MLLKCYNLYFFQFFLHQPISNYPKGTLMGFEQKKSCGWPTQPSWRCGLLEPPPGVCQCCFHPWPIGLIWRNIWVWIKIYILCHELAIIDSLYVNFVAKSFSSHVFPKNWDFGSYCRRFHDPTSLIWKHTLSSNTLQMFLTTYSYFQSNSVCIHI